MKFIYGEYNEKTGVSIVKLKDKENNEYIGKAYLHPDDKEYASQFAGCRLAEYRAWIKYYQYQRRIKKAQLKELENLAKEINENYLVPGLKTQRLVWSHIRQRRREISQWEENIKTLKNLIKSSQEVREKIIKGQKELISPEEN